MNTMSVLSDFAFCGIRLMRAKESIDTSIGFVVVCNCHSMPVDASFFTGWRSRTTT